jgi:hypothetical protein
LAWFLLYKFDEDEPKEEDELDDGVIAVNVYVLDPLL